MLMTFASIALAPLLSAAAPPQAVPPIAPPAPPPEWVTMLEADNGIVFKMDMASVETGRPGTIHARIVVTIPEAHPDEAVKSQQIWSFRCSEATLTTLTMDDYDRSGARILSWTDTAPEHQYRAPDPGSVGEDAMRAACTALGTPMKEI